MTTVIKNPSDFLNYVGKELGASDWVTIDQKAIDDFANATGDRQWIHVDVERAKKEMPGGKTIAHGYLTLAMLPRLGPLFRVEQRSRALNYGVDKLRFTGMVPEGSRVRARQTVKKVEPIEGGQRIYLDTKVEVEGKEKPAMVAELIIAFFD